MRTRIIEMLTFPRILAQESLAAPSCPHGGQFQSDSASCESCEKRGECAWLADNDAFSALAARPALELVGELRFAIEYVGEHPSRAGHSHRRCTCIACRWLSAAHRLLLEAQGRAQTVLTD